ncbi:hypothetical protein HOY82DRAFT_624273 [Tuber indicum]|nr:hypothetical protein HOY82DRAFT_624273 [Tuber indicum]
MSNSLTELILRLSEISSYNNKQVKFVHKEPPEIPGLNTTSGDKPSRPKKANRVPRPVSHKFDYLKGGKGTTERSRAIRTNSAPIAPTAGPADPRPPVPSPAFPASAGASESRPANSRALTTLMAPTRPPLQGGRKPQAKKSAMQVEDTEGDLVVSRRLGSAKSPILLNSSDGEQSSGEEENLSDGQDDSLTELESDDDDEPRPRRDRNRRANPRKRRRRR